MISLVERISALRLPCLIVGEFIKIDTQKPNLMQYCLLCNHNNHRGLIMLENNLAKPKYWYIDDIVHTLKNGLNVQFYEKIEFNPDIESFYRVLNPSDKKPGSLGRNGTAYEVYTNDSIRLRFPFLVSDGQVSTQPYLNNIAYTRWSILNTEMEGSPTLWCNFG